MTTLVPFCKPADLITLVPVLTDDQATLVCDMVSAAIRESLGWNVDQVTNATYTQVVPRNRQAYLVVPALGLSVARWSGTVSTIQSVVLPAMNVTAVASVVCDGLTLDTATYDWTPSGTIYLGVPAAQKVTVTYTAGYVRSPQDQAPGVFRTVALDHAVRLATNPSGIQSYSIGSASESFTTSAQDFADQDQRLDSYRVKGPL